MDPPNLNMALLKDILPDLYDLGQKKKHQSKRIFKTISKIKDDQKQKYQYVKKINQELNKVCDQVKRIEYQDITKDSDLYYYYDKVLEEIAYLTNKLRKYKRKKKITNFKSFYWNLDKYMNKQKNINDIDKCQNSQEDEKEYDDTSVVVQLPKMNFRSEQNIDEDCQEIKSKVAKSVGPLNVRKQKRTRKYKEDRDKSIRNKFTCFCNSTFKMNLSQYVIHKNTVHKVSPQVLNNEINQMNTQKSRPERSNVIKMVSHDTQSDNGLSYRKNIKYGLKQKRKLYDPEDQKWEYEDGDD